ncbi:RHS repeat protein [Paracidovorax citrulli]|uniref:RHS repeat domain-containing protein n=1 Tax=Paracidovorax citrulli TaxID=80869 RepID=UPI00087F8FBC|nr:RHS repeat domain-containing protein [Paracidovorax citrulli]UMT89192.1 RHS repeat protein [Paracidovorax citrulli]WIY36058.1 RHS repeat protein [Paracidovorax citrulli]SDL60350.1 YD repeat-containing protein [Paracidovorax citrulli]
MGRLVAHKVGRRQALQGQPGLPSPQALRDRDQGLPALPQLPSGDRIARQYRYDPTGHLIATRDGLRGDSHYRYDPLGRILAEHVKVVVALIKQPEAAYSMRSPRHWRCRRAQG